MAGITSQSSFSTLALELQQPSCLEKILNAACQAYESEETFEICVMVVFFLSVFLWRLVFGEPAFLKRGSSKGKLSKKACCEGKDTPEHEPAEQPPTEPLETQGSEEATKKDSPKAAWKAPSLQKLQDARSTESLSWRDRKPSQDRQQRDRTLSQDQQRGDCVAVEAQKMVAMLSSQYTQALRQYRDFVRRGKDAEIRSEEFYRAFLETSVRVNKPDVVRELLEAMSRNKVVPSARLRDTLSKSFASRQMHSETDLMEELFGPLEASKAEAPWRKTSA